MSQFVLKSFSRSDVDKLVNPIIWDYPFLLDKDEYPCLTDGATFLILTIEENICANLTLIKHDKRIFNYIDVVLKVLELPFTMYYFNSDRRLGNKYKFITDLLGGIFFEKEGKYYYTIDASVARRKLAERHFLKKTRGCKPLCDCLEKFISMGLENIKNCFMNTTIKLNDSGVIVNKILIENEYNLCVEKIKRRLFKSLKKSVIVNDEFLEIWCDTDKSRFEENINSFIINTVNSDIEFSIYMIAKFTDIIIQIFNSACQSRVEYIEIKSKILGIKINKENSKATQESKE
jgi:hypothetical protein